VDTNPSIVRQQATAGNYNTGVTLEDRPGKSWVDGLAEVVGFNTVLPPNSPSGHERHQAPAGIHSATSRHTGGVHALMADGAVRFISENINTGTLSAPSPDTTGGQSPYGVWGALGSKSGGEVVGEF
jgi:prepilin-type processing-associated H-X9-DG protein